MFRQVGEIKTMKKCRQLLDLKVNNIRQISTISSLFAAIVFISGGTAVAAADPIVLRAGATTYRIDPATLEIEATNGAGRVAIMPPLHAAETATPSAAGAGWTWRDAEGRTMTADVEDHALHVTITAAKGTSLAWDLPPAHDGTWLVPDGEGMAFKADDAFWRKAYTHEHCFHGTASLSFPAWSYMDAGRAITYALGDGLKSELCVHDAEGLQAKLTHDFADGTQTLDLLFATRPAEPLAPALFYRQVLKSRGQFKAFADKWVPKLPHLFGAPQAYVWGDGRDLAFLDDLKALGIRRIVLSYDQDPVTQTHLVGPDYLRRANRMGYLAGPYDAFDNAQPAATADSPSAIWSDDLYPAGCIRDADGKVHIGFADRGCELSSEAVARHSGAPNPASRYAAHVADGATEVFVDVDAFGEFYDDFSPDHPMTMAQDRAHRVDRLGLGITKYHLVIGSENVTAWSAGVAHFSHGTAQAHVGVLWRIQSDQSRFGGYWPFDRPPLYFRPLQLTPDETRLLFAPADRLPLFEAVFHDSVVASERWELGMMKITGVEHSRFARSLLYGTPTMWNLDRKELARVGPWLKAAQDDFKTAHGWGTPVALTGFRWLSEDRLVQQATYAGGRTLIANFGETPWQGLKPDCVRLIRGGHADTDMCPPADPAPFP